MVKRNNLRNTALGALGGILFILLLIFVLPIDVVYKVTVNTKTYPSKEWKLIQEGSQFKTQAVDYSGTLNAPAKNFVFDRGDVIDMDFDEEVYSGSFVNKDQVLLQFSSMMHNLRIQRALNEIAIQESQKTAGQAAMKWPLMKEAQEAVSLAESNLALQEANHARLAQLKEDGVISQAELDAQVNRLEVAQRELAIAERRVSNASFEQKPEDIAVFNTRIETVDKELDVLLAQQSAYTVTSPFAGQVAIQPEPGVVLKVTDTSSVSLLFPFPADQRAYLTDKSTLQVDTEQENDRLPIKLDHQVAMVQGDQHCLGISSTSSSTTSLGELRTATVICDTVKLREYILRKIL
jgi:hypothetical protein